MLTWFPSHVDRRRPVDAEQALVDTESVLARVARRLPYDGPYGDAVHASLIVAEGAHVPADGRHRRRADDLAPERIGGVRNWDYRYCWLRDATFTLYALLNAGYTDEARAWRDWLLRAVGGDPAKAQILYGVGGQRAIPSRSSTGCRVTRLAAGAHRQRRARAVPARRVRRGDGRATPGARARPRPPTITRGRCRRNLLEYLERAWDHPDEGIWEVRGPRRHFTHSKVLAWVAFDRAVQAIRALGCRGPSTGGGGSAQEIHDEVLREGFNVELNSFTQAYGSRRARCVDLLIPILGFLPPMIAA